MLREMIPNAFCYDLKLPKEEILLAEVNTTTITLKYVRIYEEVD
jgi:hypothetical protein